MLVPSLEVFCRSFSTAAFIQAILARATLSGVSMLADGCREGSFLNYNQVGGV